MISEGATLEALDFPPLLRALTGWAQTPIGRHRLEGLEPGADRGQAEEWLAQIAEFRTFIQRHGTLALAPARPLDAALRAAAIEGTVLDFDEMVAVYRTAQVGRDMAHRLRGIEDLQRLTAIGAGLDDLGALITQIETVFDREGQVKDSASPELAALRRKKGKLRSRLLDSLEQMVKADRLDGVLRDRLVTQRGGRYVVPVRSGKRGALPGVVHDTSSSGQTLYVEPLDSLDQQNAMVEADRAERQEVHRLLADLTGHVRAAAGALARTETAIGDLDARQAKARFADLMDAIQPQFSDHECAIRGARHPLMIAGVDADGDVGEGNDEDGDAAAARRSEPVPLDLEIPDGISAVVITGPNTGGKTVVLKTVGLLTVMAQCGLPVPAVTARLRWCPRVHADIGDDQSIVASLSTFSAHLTRIKRFLDDSPAGSLVLLDELGTGTDPAEGAALGIAVLEHLAEIGATTLVSTHHDALKAFAHNAPCALNAAMEFDSATLAPTYRLRVGLPGRSNAFDIAEGLGLDAGLVGRARDLIGVDTKQLDSLIRSVEGEAEALASSREDVEERQGRLAEVHERYEALNQRLAELRDELADAGRKAVEDALAQVRADGEQMLATLSEELGETRKSRSAQDRRAAWAARVGGAEAGARRRIDETVRAAEEALAAVTDGAESAAAADVAYADAVEIPDEPDDPMLALSRGDAVVVMPLNLRGQVMRDWEAGQEGGDVEVDVHGKRLIVSRRQIRRLGH